MTSFFLAVCVLFSLQMSVVASTGAVEWKGRLSRVMPVGAGMFESNASSCMPLPMNVTNNQSSVGSPEELEPWEVELMLSGGIAGVRTKAKISSDGRVVVFDEKKNRRVEFQISEQDLAPFSSLVEGITKQQPIIHTSVCADCFQYELNVTAKALNIKFKLNDMDLSKSGLKPLIDELMKLQTNALSR